MLQYQPIIYKEPFAGIFNKFSIGKGFGGAKTLS